MQERSLEPMKRPYSVRTSDRRVEAVVVADSEADAIAQAIERLDRMVDAGAAFLGGFRPDIIDWEAAALPEHGVLDMRINR